MQKIIQSAASGGGSCVIKLQQSDSKGLVRFQSEGIRLGLQFGQKNWKYLDSSTIPISEESVEMVRVLEKSEYSDCPTILPF